MTDERRPSEIYRPELTARHKEDGVTIFTASYGCVWAIGITPEEAMERFDANWKGAAYD